jgi:hypothetical protein
VSSVAAVPPPKPAGYKRSGSSGKVVNAGGGGGGNALAIPAVASQPVVVNRDQLKASNEEVKRVMGSLQQTGMDHLINMRQQLSGLNEMFEDALQGQEV